MAGSGTSRLFPQTGHASSRVLPPSSMWGKRSRLVIRPVCSPTASVKSRSASRRSSNKARLSITPASSARSSSRRRFISRRRSCTMTGSSVRIGTAASGVPLSADCLCVALACKRPTWSAATMLSRSVRSPFSTKPAAYASASNPRRALSTDEASCSAVVNADSARRRARCASRSAAFFAAASAGTAPRKYGIVSFRCSATRPSPCLWKR